MHIDLRFWIDCAVWGMALAWLVRIGTALRMLPGVPDLGKESTEDSAAGTVCVIVPARNEEKSIEATLRMLLAVEGVAVEILAVDDRSEDGTGAIMEQVAVEARAQGKNLRVMHVDALPAGWMGKTHAMALAARQTQADWLLFTDADVLFSADSVRRAMVFGEKARAEHIVLYPTVVVKSFGERMMISFFMALSVWGARPWRIADDRAKRDSIGVGAFNLVRREVYEAIGGFEALRMEVLEDLQLGRSVKAAGYRQRVAFGKDMVRVRWAEGAAGVVRNLTKNAFALASFRPLVLLAICGAVLALGLLPLLGLLGGIAGWLATAAMFVSIALLYAAYRRQTGIAWGYVLVFPLAACVFAFAMLRSMVLALMQGGVVWRGTLYPLAELRRHARPLW